MKAKHPKVSIVIPVYNCSYVHEAIESALNQTYPNHEVIVVDDGSTEHKELVTPYMDRIRYIPKVNGGTATALNTGIVHATGDYFAWLSSDDTFVPQKVEQQLDFMRRRNLSFSHSAYSYINHLSEEIGEVYPELGTRAEMIETLLIGCPINGCTVMLDMKVFERILPHYDLDIINKPLVRYRVHDDMGTFKHHQAIQNEKQIIQALHRTTLRSLI
ncbi:MULTISPECIES: glycosyltransferase family A protein [unclassified Paenibacillus]|uniref:Glycosyltransferase family 2 protein n=1 Tax=Paenibacillus provencensis TaxID=441151 RepID=A0ABW3PY21_9BACL|nr:MULTISPECIES: glycosyltransferase family A protein [unclassified Paenibacillus]MCM3129872.1 glycosyltransferase family 2 protein [Paenibacillus sp. MER 78]SFS91314.1 Glycosyl transferase family 2 [Paenibacillus sp. 453mf]